MGSLWAVELDVDRRRASLIFWGLARGEVKSEGVGVDESLSCELMDWVLLRHEPAEGDAIVAVVVLSNESGGLQPHCPSNAAPCK
jgi:hypothetical protein